MKEHPLGLHYNPFRVPKKKKHYLKQLLDSHWLTEAPIRLYDVINVVFAANPESDMNSLNNLFFPCLFYSLFAFSPATLSLSFF